MNVQKLKFIAYNKEAVVIRINVCYLLFLIVLWEMSRPLCVLLMRTSHRSGSKLSVRNFSRLFYKGIKLS